eukprot:9257579-Pyramimonas_sp.AAC.1
MRGVAIGGLSPICRRSISGSRSIEIDREDVRYGCKGLGRPRRSFSSGIGHRKWLRMDRS